MRQRKVDLALDVEVLNDGLNDEVSAALDDLVGVNVRVDVLHHAIDVLISSLTQNISIYHREKDLR